ncbi:MAG: PASTA domain-containing protein, partial [Acidimicrobiales bacterium]
GATGVVPRTGAAVAGRTAVLPAHGGYDGGTPPVYHSPPTYEPPRRTGVFVAVLVGALFAITGLVILFVQILGRGADTPALVDVPDVTNQPQADAARILEAQDFIVRIVPEKNGQVAAGLVFAQNPESGVRAPKGSQVTLKVSSGAELFPLPNVVGSQEPQARARLEGWVVQKVDKNDPVVPAGEVMAQSPEAGSQQAKGVTVTLTVSAGPQLDEVPDVAGKPLGQASNELGRAGFEVDPVEEPSATVPAGRVTRTEPAAKERIAPNSKVKLFVSTGPSRPRAPNVLGKTQSEAVAAIEAAKLKAGVSERSTDRSEENGKVAAQDPQPNEEMDEGDTVDIKIGVLRSPPTSTTSTTAGRGPTTTSSGGSTTTTGRS